MVLDNFAVNRRRTAWRVEATLKRLYRYFGRDARATTITSDALERYVAARLKAGLAPATIKLEVATVRRRFRLALRAGRLARMPLMPQIHVSNARQGFFEPAELAAVLGALAQGGSYRDRRGDDQKVQPHPELVPLVRFAAAHRLAQGRSDGVAVEAGGLRGADGAAGAGNDEEPPGAHLSLRPLAGARHAAARAA